MTARARGRRGFSLFEVLIAIALVLALLGAMFAFLWDLLSARERILDETSRRRAAAAFLQSLERDLMTSVTGDDAAGAGVAGDEMSIRVLCRRVPAYLADGRDQAAALADLELVEYGFDGRDLSIRRSVPGASRAAAVGPQALGGTVSRLRLRFHDGAGWRDSFDSLDAGHLPRAVEVAVWFDPWPGDDAPEDESPERDFDPGDDERPAAGFDERAFALESDLETFDDPWPDRVRIIVVPDAVEGAGDPEEGA